VRVHCSGGRPESARHYPVAERPEESRDGSVDCVRCLGLHRGRIFIDVTAEGAVSTPDVTIQTSPDNLTWHTHTAIAQISATGQTRTAVTNFGNYLDQPVGERGLPVVDMGDNAEISDMLHNRLLIFPHPVSTID
jgi:hypothetical protein